MFMNTSKNKILILYFLAIASIVVGFMLYLLFRENTYVSDIVEKYVDLEYPRHCARAFESDFLKFYFPDFLWAMSLDCWIHTVIFCGRRSSIICSAIVGLFGILYEVLQYTRIVTGTFDIVDIIMYLSAALLVSVLYCTVIHSQKEK